MVQLRIYQTLYCQALKERLDRTFDVVAAHEVHGGVPRRHRLPDLNELGMMLAKKLMILHGRQQSCCTFLGCQHRPARHMQSSLHHLSTLFASSLTNPVFLADDRSNWILHNA